MRSKKYLEDRAEELLAAAGVGDVAPVPVEVVAAHLGAVIRSQPFPSDDVAAMLLREDGRPPVIGINSHNAPVRQRFSISHEIAHLQLHPGQPLILDRMVRANFRDATSSAATDVQEIEANAFAAALLMPKHLVRKYLQRQLECSEISDEEIVAGLAQDLGVSKQAMEYRLINLGIFTPA